MATAKKNQHVESIDLLLTEREATGLYALLHDHVSEPLQKNAGIREVEDALKRLELPIRTISSVISEGAILDVMPF